MAEPIVRTFVIDTTQAEQNLTSLGTTTQATTAIVDSLYNELIRLDQALNELSPNDEQFQMLATQIKAVEESITSIETGKFQDIATDVEAVGNAISGVDTTNVEQLNQSISNIDTANAVGDIENINNALSTIDASTAVSQVDSVNVALDEVDTNNVTGQIQNINSELASVDVSTAINEIAQINEEFSRIDTTNLISEITGISDSVNQIDTTNVVGEIANINTELNNIDATNVTADLNEISTAISGIDASNAVSEISSIDGALTGINTGEVVSEINNIGEAVADINTDNLTDVGNAVEGVVAPVTQLASATDQLNTELKDTKVDTSSIETASADFQELAVEEENVVASSKSLKAQLRELQAELANTEPDSAKYRELSAAAGELKDRIGDAAEAVGTQAGGAFERVGGSLGLVTSRIANLDFEGAAEGAKLLAKNITDIKPGDIAKGIQGIGSAFASIGKALLTNPIFLIGAAIAAAIVYAEELLSLIDGVTDAETEALNIQKERAALAKEQVDAIGAQEESLKRQGLTEKQITDLKLQALDAAILEQQAVVETTRIQAEGQIKAAERNAEYLKTFLDFVTFPQRKLAEFFEGFVNGSIDVLNKLGLGIEKIDVSSVFEDVNNFVVKKIFDPEQERKDQEKIVKEAEKTLVSLNNQRDGILNAQAAKEKAAAQKAADDKAKVAKDAADAQLKAEQEVSDLLNQLYEENVKEFEDAEKVKTAAAEAEAQKRLQAEQEYDAAITALRAEQDAANLTQEQKDIIAIDNKYLTLREKAIAAGQSTLEVDAAYKAALEQQEIDSAERRKAYEFAVQDSKLQATSDALGAISGLVGSFAKGDEKRAKRAFQIQKGISIGQATIDTYKSANAIFAAAAANPATILFPAQPFIAAGAAIAAGLINVKTIAGQQFQGGGSPGGGGGQSAPSLPDVGGGGGGGGEGSQPAQFNPLAASFLQDRPEQLTPRAYVLAGDVASQQEVREKVQDLARIG
jgi:hypothetical protein